MSELLATYPRPYLVLVTGQRDWGEGPARRDEFDDAVRLLVGLRARRPDATIVEGGCPAGFDRIARMVWWECWGLPMWCYPAAWDFCGEGCPPGTGHRLARRPRDRVHPGEGPDYCPFAGPRRNDEMLALRPDECLAAYGRFSLGARKTARLAREARIPVTELHRIR